MTQKSYEFAEQLLKAVKLAGADTSDLMIFSNQSKEIEVRLGKLENLTSAENVGFSLRAIKGKRPAIISANRIEFREIDNIAKKIVEMASLVPEDEFLNIAEDSAYDIPDLDLFDSTIPKEEDLLILASNLEAAALNVAGVTNSSGGSAYYSTSNILLATSNNFMKSYQTSIHGFSASVIAGTGESMQTYGDGFSAVYYNDLIDPAIFGTKIGEEAIAKLNPRKIPTAKMPVIFDKKVAKSILSAFASAINGANVSRGTTFLQNSMNERIFGENINIFDDPLIIRGKGSRPFDGEAVKTSKLQIVEDGKLREWLLDLRSKAQLGLSRVTGNASRGLAVPPSPSTSNFYLANGVSSKEELIADIKSGVYISELFGHGGNVITGDFSQGASGFMIENGKITYPVSEITVAFNLGDLFLNLTAANDLEFTYATNSPTILAHNLTVAGV